MQLVSQRSQNLEKHWVPVPALTVPGNALSLYSPCLSPLLCLQLQRDTPRRASWGNWGLWGPWGLPGQQRQT